MRGTSREIKPFLSVLLIVLTLFLLVFFKMEMRRVGYEVHKTDRRYKTLVDLYRFKTIQYAQAVRPERVKQLATRMTGMQTARSGQIIYLSERGVAVPQ
jgi:hypothetical protein